MLMVQNDGVIEQNVNHRIQLRSMKWRSALGVICEKKKLEFKLKGKF